MGHEQMDRHTRDKIVRNDFEHAKHGPKGGRQDAWSSAGIQKMLVDCEALEERVPA
jgi:hypothetical protein